MIVTIIRTIIIFILLNVALRLTGKRQIGELEISELITTFLLSELATAPIADPEIPLTHAILPIFLITTIEVIITFITSRNVKIKEFLDGCPSVLIRNGVINQSELQRVRMSCEDLLGQLRQNGIGDPADVKYALLEEDGKFSIFQTDKPSGNILHAMYVDGHICPYNLRLSNKSEKWLRSKLHAAGQKREVFLYAINDDGKATIIYKDKGSK
ncbi:MAG: DUF421 domain-containing protein [Clostridia bacterium]|nr:DUF421 domain-containing protein [Clostridia bacterium]